MTIIHYLIKRLVQFLKHLSDRIKMIAITDTGQSFIFLDLRLEIDNVENQTKQQK